MKRKSLTLLLALSLIQIYAQEPVEKEINSKVVAATVFQNSAQVQRNKTVALKKGIQVFKICKPFSFY